MYGWLFNPNGESNARACAGHELADVAPNCSGGFYAVAFSATHFDQFGRM